MKTEAPLKGVTIAVHCKNTYFANSLRNQKCSIIHSIEIRVSYGVVLDGADVFLLLGWDGGGVYTAKRQTFVILIEKTIFCTINSKLCDLK